MQGLELIQSKIALVKKEFSLTQQILLVAVSKKQSIEKIRQMYQLGVFNFAENYVQEFREKKEALADLKIKWHFIGRLQTNKVKYVVGSVEYIHSVDRSSLVSEINKVALKLNTQQRVLLQVSFTESDVRSGCKVEELEELIHQCLQSPGILLEGLMTVPPVTDRAEESYKYFIELQKLRDKFCAMVPKDRGSFSQLSMGMSSDFEFALRAGATMLRVGSALFGSRD